jgi:serine/threonine protein kinase
MICDFGRSQSLQDQPRETSNSSPFRATLRYMSPELFVRTVIGPTPASDMWAYGCVALEVRSASLKILSHSYDIMMFAYILCLILVCLSQILCRTQPYQEVESDYEVIEQIKQGRPPSDRPRGARATLVNDSLWTALASCWREQSWRPTSRMFLELLTQMLKNGEVPTSPALVDLLPFTIDGPPLPWPEDLLDLKGSVSIEKGSAILASTLRSYVWKYVHAFSVCCYLLIAIHDQGDSEHTQSKGNRPFNGRS